MNHRFRPYVFSVVLLALFVCSSFAEVRTWKNNTGAEIEAEFISQDDSTVTIRRVADRKIFEIAINTLSESDQSWLESQREAADGGSDKGIYIAAGNGGHRMSSLDGLTWTNHEYIDKPAHDQNDLKDIAVGNGVCVVVGGFSRSNIFTTGDGVSWNKNEFNMGVLSGVIFVDDRFLAFGESGRVGASSDGLSWELIGDAKFREHLQSEAESLGLDAPIKSNVRKWSHANGLFVGAGDNGVILSTRDFETWNFAPRIEPQSRLAIETDGSGFVVRGENTVHYSSDGNEWMDVTPDLPEKVRLNSLVHDGERFILNSRGEEAWDSADGKEWKPVSGQTFPGQIAALRPDLLYSFEIYWKYTEDMKVSTDGGKSWESVEIPGPVGVTCVIHAKGLPSD